MPRLRYEEGARQLERTFRDGLQRPGRWRERLHAAVKDTLATVLSEERGGEEVDASWVHLEVVTGAAHHAVGAQLTAERCDLDSIRTRIDNLIAHYVPA